MVCTSTRTSTSARVAPVPLTMLLKPWNFHPWRCYHTFLKRAAGNQKHRLFLHEQESWKLEKKALKNQQIIIKTYTKRQKYKTMTLYLFFFCKTFHVHIYFQWRCKLFQCFIVQGLFSDFPHQKSLLVCSKEPLPFPIKGSCCALPPTAWLHSAQKFLHEFPCWMTNFGVVK